MDYLCWIYSYENWNQPDLLNIRLLTSSLLKKILYHKHFSQFLTTGDDLSMGSLTNLYLQVISFRQEKYLMISDILNKKKSVKYLKKLKIKCDIQISKIFLSFWNLWEHLLHK